MTDRESMQTAFDVVARVMTFVRENRSSLTEDDIIIKPDGSPVTTRDLAGQVLYVMHLEHELGLHPGELRLCGEETSEILRGPGSSDLRDRIAGLVASAGIHIASDDVPDVIDRGSLRPSPRTGSTHWICDPIDGTKRYISGHSYSTCLAFVRDGRLVAGAIGVPDPPAPVEPGTVDGGTLVGAYLGGGTYQSIRDGNGRSLVKRAFDRSSLELPRVRVARSVGHPDLGPGLSRRMAEANLDPIAVEVDNQSKFASLVTGQVDLIAQRGSSVDIRCSWDFAPGILISEEYGVTVSDGTGRSFDFDTGAFLTENTGVCCAPDFLHPGLVT